jgi:hypothetical protein
MFMEKILETSYKICMSIYRNLLLMSNGFASCLQMQNNLKIAIALVFAQSDYKWLNVYLFCLFVHRENIILVVDILGVPDFKLTMSDFFVFKV